MVRATIATRDTALARNTGIDASTGRALREAVDTVPTRLAASVRDMRRADGVVYVPGHGRLATPADIDRYLTVLDAVETAARDGHRRGIPAAEAGGAFALPPAVGEWTLFGRNYFPRVFEAWYRELG